MIPVEVAKELGLWPPEGAFEVEFDTAGGVLKAWLYLKAGKVSIITTDVKSDEVEVDIVVSQRAPDKRCAG